MSETAHLQEVTELVPVQTFAGQRWEKALPVQGGRVGGGRQRGHASASALSKGNSSMALTFRPHAFTLCML